MAYASMGKADEIQTISGTSAVAAPAAASTDGALTNLAVEGQAPELVWLEILEDHATGGAYTITGPVIVWCKVGGIWVQYATLNGGGSISILEDRGWMTLLTLPPGTTHVQIQCAAPVEDSGTPQATITLREHLSQP